MLTRRLGPDLLLSPGYPHPASTAPITLPTIDCCRVARAPNHPADPTDCPTTKQALVRDSNGMRAGDAKSPPFAESAYGPPVATGTSADTIATGS